MTPIVSKLSVAPPVARHASFAVRTRRAGLAQDLSPVAAYWPLARRRRGFSLLEVVAAIGILAIGIVTVLGLFAPLTKSVTRNNETEAAAHVIDALIERLQSLPFDQVAGNLKTSAEILADDARPDYNPNDTRRETKVFFASLAGDKMGQASDPVWTDPVTRRPSDREKFFEIALIRNATLSPAANDPAAPWLAFNVRVRWPAFLPTAGGAAVPVGFNSAATVPYDHSKQQVMFFSGSIRR